MRKNKIFDGIYTYTANVSSYNTEGFVDEYDNILSEPKYYQVHKYNDEFAIVKKIHGTYYSDEDIYYGIIDRNLQEVVSPNSIKYKGKGAYLKLTERINSNEFNNKNSITCITNSSIKTPDNTIPCEKEFIIEFDKIIWNKGKYYMMCPHCGYIVEIHENKLSKEIQSYLMDKYKNDNFSFRKLELYSELKGIDNLEKQDIIDHVSKQVH